MIDMHCHIIPYTDDGAVDNEASLEMGRHAQELGYTDIICTSHYIIHDIENDYTEYRENVEKLNKLFEENGIKVKLHPGNEIFFTNDIVDLVKDKKVSSLNDTKYVLVEFPLFNMEYSWSVGYKCIFEHQWHVLELPYDSRHNPDAVSSLGEYAPLSGGYIWEGECDGSIDEAISIRMPSSLLIEGMNLHQKEYNGHFYNNNDELIIIDGKTAGCADGLLIREDALNEFLKTNNYVLNTYFKRASVIGCSF